MKNMKKLLSYKRTRITVLIISDAVLLLMAAWLSYFIRFNPSLASGYLKVFRQTFLYAIPIKLIVFFVFGLYSSLWRYAGLDELTKIFFAAVFGNLAFLGINIMGSGLPILETMSLNVPRGIYIINILLDAIFIGGFRLSYRVTRRMMRREPTYTRNRKRTLIVGGGDAGAMVIKELKENPRSEYQPVVVLDDDSNKWNRKLSGLPIAGGCDDIIKSIEKYQIENIIIAIPNVTNGKVKRIFNICEETGLPVQKLPGVHDMVSGKVTLADIKPVEIEDLLGRPSIKLDPVGIGEYLNGKSILVTGGGGSIGSELCRQIATYKPATLYILDICENYIYDIQQELRYTYPELKVEAIIASVRDRANMISLLNKIKPYTVFHAAAHKHVPLMEDAPAEAVKNNIFGTYNIVTASHIAGVRKFVLISTDKAVNPTNVMGATKRFCEMIVQAKSRESETEFAMVRFGNVLGSNGSVIPLFKKQIAAGGPVTVTHKDIIRYFMTIPEAVSLVLQSGSLAKGGEIFVLDMGEPVKIDELARNLIKLSGYEPDEDIEIVYSGLRPGEKLYEELLMAEEGLDATTFEKIFVAKPMNMQMNDIMDGLANLEERIKNNGCIREVLKQCVDTYKEEIYSA